MSGSKKNVEKYFGLLLGAMTGDSLGLPFEMLSPVQIKRIYGRDIRHNFLPIPFIGRFGICSDDTEHLWITALSLCKTPKKNIDIFGRELSSHLKRWLLTCPIGIGKATLLSCLKMLVGTDYNKSGIYSAGNGAAIRAVIIGAFHSNDLESMFYTLRVSTLMTHTDPRTYEGSLVIALAAMIAMNSKPERTPTSFFFSSLPSFINGEELLLFLNLAESHLSQNSSLTDYLNDLPGLKKGISGYVNHTVPAVIYAWLRYYGNYRETICQIIAAGGDTDSTAALAGALSGITVGSEGIPKDWLKGAWGWPLTVNNWHQVSQALADPESVQVAKPVNLLFLFRNLVSFPIFGFHIVRRIIDAICHQ